MKIKRSVNERLLEDRDRAYELFQDLLLDADDVGDLYEILHDMEEDGIAKKEVDRLVRDNLDYLLSWFEDRIYRDDKQNIFHFLEAIDDIFDLSKPDVAAEVRTVLTSSKQDVLKNVISSVNLSMHDHDISVLNRFLGLLKRLVDWPELDHITQDLDARRIKFGDIAHVVNKLRILLNDKMLDKQLSKILREFGKSDPKAVEDALRPLDADFAAWFDRLARENSAVFALDQVGWLLDYADCRRWPNLISAINGRKDDVIKMMLASIKNSKGDYFPRREINILRSLDMDWPELDIIERSLGRPLAEGLYSGQMWRIEHVAKKLKQQLSSKNDIDDMKVAYTLQELSRTDPDEVDKVLRPMARDFAEWFERFAKRGGAMFGVKELGWLMSYVNGNWPEIAAVVDRYKDDIVKSILYGMKNHENYNPKNDIKVLRDLGVKWTELKTIETSLSADTKRLRESELRVNQQNAVDGWYARLYRDLEHDYHDTIAWSLIMMGRATAQLSRPPYKPFFDRHKHGLLKSILAAVANKDDQLRYSDRELSEMMLGIRKLGLDWPELNVIERSLRADIPFEESTSVSDPETMITSLDDRLKWMDKTLNDPSSWNNLRISLLMDSTHILNRIDTVHAEKVVPILDRYRYSIVRAMVLMIKNRGLDAWSVRNATESLQRFVPSWRELQTIWKSLKAEGLDDGKKLLKAAGLDEDGLTNESSDGPSEGKSKKVQTSVDWIMLSMLRLMEIGTTFALEQTITQLENLGYGDREILKFLSKHDEDVSDWVDYLLEANRGHNRYRQLDQVMNLIELGATWPSLVTVLNKHKDVVVKHMLSQFNKSGDDIEWIIDNMDGWCKKLRKVGISWPELGIIEKSVDREKSRIASRDVFEQSVTGNVVDQCIEVLAHNLDHVSKIDYTNLSPMNMLARLSKLIDDGNATADDVVSGLDSIKDSILRYLLLQVKKGKIVTYNVDIPLYIRELRDIGVSWPELSIIEKSLSEK